jgi:sirohydrochlorin ferrochelatase
MNHRPTLLAVAHGTRSAAGRRQLLDLAGAVARRSPGLDVRLCYVDVQEPRIAEIVPTVRDAVVVPLLLSAGYHVRVDIADAVRGTHIPVAPPLGPDDVLLESLTRHLAAATRGGEQKAEPTRDADAVVLAAAGSSDPAWRESVHDMAARIPGGAHVAYAAGSGPKVADVVADLRRRGARRVVIAAYLLADGLFYRTLHRAGADAVTPPLCLDPAVAGLVLRRYQALTMATARM